MPSSRKLVRGLSLWRPWPYAIFHLNKRIENRPWAPPNWMVGQYIALHATNTWDNEGAEFIEEVSGSKLPPENEHIGGAIVGVARLDGWTTNEATITSDQQPWFFGPVGWKLSEVKQLTNPIPTRGYYKLWELDETLLVALRREYRNLTTKKETTDGHLPLLAGLKG